MTDVLLLILYFEGVHKEFAVWYRLKRLRTGNLNKKTKTISNIMNYGFSFKRNIKFKLDC